MAAAGFSRLHDLVAHNTATVLEHDALTQVTLQRGMFYNSDESQ